MRRRARRVPRAVERRFAAYARAWIDTLHRPHARGIRETTRDGLPPRLERDAIPFFGAMRALGDRAARREGSTPRHSPEPRPAPPNRSGSVLAPVRALLATAVEDGLIRVEPGRRAADRGAAATRPADEDERAGEGADARSELRALLAATPPRVAAVLPLPRRDRAADRRGDRARWRDVDLGRASVQVRRRFYRGAGRPAEVAVRQPRRCG